MAYQVQKSFQLISSGNMASSITSSAQESQYQDNIAIQLIWTGSPVGAFSIQVSVDYKEDAEKNIIVAGTWSTLTLSNAITASGSGDNAYIDLNQLSAPYYRIVYTRTSGTGTLNAYVSSKGV